MGRLLDRHSTYEELLTEHVDGRLDAAGEARFQAHLRTCQQCGAQLHAMEEVVNLLHSEPLVEAPRSFALPLTVGHPSGNRQAAPERAGGFFGWAGSGSIAALRSLQMATAAMALVLVALVGLEMTGVMSPQPQDDFRVTQETSFGAAESDDMQSFAVPESPPGDAIAGLADGEARQQEGEPSPSEQDPNQTNLVAAEAGQGRSAMEWAQLALSGLTAALALGVVGFTWILYRQPG